MMKVLAIILGCFLIAALAKAGEKIKNQTGVLSRNTRDSDADVAELYNVIYKHAPTSPDENFERLKSMLKTVETGTEAYGDISRYLERQKEGEPAGFTLQIEKVFTVKKSSEDDAFVPFEEYDNQMLLWHGTPSRNIQLILENGFRLPKPSDPEPQPIKINDEVIPVKNAVLGRGIYFADFVLEAGMYATAIRDGEVPPVQVILILAQVALGRIEKTTEEKGTDYLPKATHFDSVKGQGKIYPVKSEQTVRGNLVIPNGRIHPDPTYPPLDEEDKQLQDQEDSTFAYSHYAIFNKDQTKIKYLVQAKVIYHRD